MEPLAKRPRGPEVPADDDFRAPELTARLGLLMHQLQRERGLMTLHVADNSWGGRRAARARERLDCNLQGFALGDDEHRRRDVVPSSNSSKPKRVEQLNRTTGKLIRVWPSGTAAAKAIGLSSASVSNCCRGLSSSGGGYVPEGMSEAEYNAAKSADAAKRQASRSKKRGSQMTLDDAKRNGVRHYTQLKGDAVNLEPKKNWLNPFADE